ncbi:hypothetical protein P5673_032436, partial [Acropora cervicornis]
GKFNVPLTQRNNKQKSALVRFWRNRDHVSLKGGKVCYDGKPVLRKSAVSDIVAKAFKETKGSGVKKLYHHLKDVCSGVGGRDIRAVLGKSLLYQWLNVRFQNKAVLKPVRARTVQIRDELDLVSMETGTIGFIPLEKKWPNCNGAINNLQRAWASSCPSDDQGRAFDGAVNKLCKKLGIKVIKGRPYHPQSQGKIERAHRSYKKKNLCEKRE